MEVALTPLINEMLQGSTRSVVALLIMVIVILMNELRASRRDLRRVQDKLDTQRTEYINTIQDKYIQRTEDMSSKYHEALMSNHATLSKLTDVVHVIRETTNDINRGD